MTDVREGQIWVCRYADRDGDHRVARVVAVHKGPDGRPSHVVSVATYQTTTTWTAFLDRYELLVDATPEGT